ncbi:hypothetical protein TrVE_jg1683 [Triparma verrucosa]|uniref:Elongation factor P n=2 Tax=Triparma TaxID=722752 RepID=A0A9W7B7M1_9STRA|nr:hypothetical protein TrST_g8350 [Triparma strigata]GMI12749.1 hypothetical protein TrVE_jg1683 [Triparma verrucosa]
MKSYAIATALLLSQASAWISPSSCGRPSTVLFGSIAPKDFKTGLTIQIDGQPTKIIEFQHVKQARGAASTKTKFKNLLTGATLQKTVQASESFDPAQIDRSDAQHTYRENGNWFFMDSESFEEKMVSDSIVDDREDWIMEGMNVQLVEFEAQGVTKPATLECGATIMVPGFIDVGEKLLIDVPNKAYMSRAK